MSNGLDLVEPVEDEVKRRIRETGNDPPDVFVEMLYAMTRKLDVAIAANDRDRIDAICDRHDLLTALIYEWRHEGEKKQ